MHPRCFFVVRDVLTGTEAVHLFRRVAVSWPEIRCSPQAMSTLSLRLIRVDDDTAVFAYSWEVDSIVEGLLARRHEEAGRRLAPAWWRVGAVEAPHEMDVACRAGGVPGVLVVPEGLLGTDKEIFIKKTPGVLKAVEELPRVESGGSRRLWMGSREMEWKPAGGWEGFLDLK